MIRVTGVNLVEQLEARKGAMKVAELSELLGVDDKHIYRMAARGMLPSFHVGGSVRFDPQEVAKWLRTKYGAVLGEGKKPPAQVRTDDNEKRDKRIA
ncbi:MAG TPA: helix-turn-helix domain-containing protein [Terracidiphilus sp.]|nr:helix-turn-helix domain-containing protein [Terracidiphilus sp.]